MAVVDLNDHEWINSDGLKVYFDTDKARAQRGGEYSVLTGGKHVVEVVIDLTTLSTTNQTIVVDNVIIPNGALIDTVTFYATVAATSSGNGTIDLGLVDQDFSTEIDFNGILAAVAKTTVDNIGEMNTVTQGTTGAGALFGTKLTNSGYIVANLNTAAYQTGKVVFRIFYSFPLAADL